MSEASPDRRTQREQLPGLAVGILEPPVQNQLPRSAEQQSRWGREAHGTGRAGGWEGRRPPCGPPTARKQVHAQASPTRAGGAEVPPLETRPNHHRESEHICHASTGFLQGRERIGIVTGTQERRSPVTATARSNSLLEAPEQPPGVSPSPGRWQTRESYSRGPQSPADG